MHAMHALTPTVKVKCFVWQALTSLIDLLVIPPPFFFWPTINLFLEQQLISDGKHELQNLLFLKMKLQLSTTEN